MSEGASRELVVAVEPRIVSEVARVGVDQEDVLEVRALVEMVGDPLEPLGVGDEHPCAGVLQSVDDLVGRPPAVEADEDRADVDRPPEREAPLGVVLAEDGDPIAVADAVLLQAGADRVGQRHELAERDLAIAVHDERLVAAAAPMSQIWRSAFMRSL